MKTLGDTSRRRLLGQGAASLAFVPSMVRAATTADVQNPAPATGDTIQGDADPEHRMTMDTMIDGQGPFRFLVDTGADRSVIAYDVAVRLGLISGEDVVVQGIARSLATTTVALRNLTFGPIAIESLAVPVLPRQWLRADGYLGLDVLDGRKVTFDFRNHKLTVGQSKNFSSWLHPNETIVRVNGSNGRLKAVDCSVDGVRAVAFIDSGAQISIGNTCLFAELQKAGANYISDAVVPVVGVTGGQAPGRLAYIANIKIGDIRFFRAYLIIADLQVFDVWGLADRPALFIGMNFLRQASEVTIDFGRKELRFKLADIRMASRG